METIEIFNAFKGVKEMNLTKVQTLVTSLKGIDSKKFNKSIELGATLKASIEAFENNKGHVFEALKMKAIPKKDVAPILWSLDLSWINKLIKAHDVAPEIRSNYIDTTPNPSIEGLLKFAKGGVTPPTPKELTISFRGKKASINKNGTFSTDLTKAEIEALIKLLREQIA